MSELFEELRISVTNDGSSSRLDLGGEIDAACCDVLHEQLTSLIDTASGDVDVDMSEVVFCDSTGLRELLTARQQLLIDGRHLRVVNPSASVTRLLELAGLTELLMPLSRQQ